MKLNIGFIGKGNMASALIKSIKNSNIKAKMIVYDKNQEKLKNPEKGVKSAASNIEVVEDSSIIFLCIKPQSMQEALNEIKGFVKNKLIVSIAAGVTIKAIQSRLKNARIIRVMPNTPCLAGEMAAGFSAGKGVAKEDIKIIESILSSAGKAIFLSEESLDAVTALSGSGPAFVARLIEAFIEAGEKQGLKKEVASELALQTFKGTAKLLQESGMSPDELVKMVSSPGGTTIAGREILENSDYKGIILKTIQKAKERSRELGKS